MAAQPTHPPRAAAGGGSVRPEVPELTADKLDAAPAVHRHIPRRHDVRVVGPAARRRRLDPSRAEVAGPGLLLRVPRALPRPQPRRVLEGDALPAVVSRPGVVGDQRLLRRQNRVDALRGAKKWYSPEVDHLMIRGQVIDTQVISRNGCFCAGRAAQCGAIENGYSTRPGFDGARPDDIALGVVDEEERRGGETHRAMQTHRHVLAGWLSAMLLKMVTPPGPRRVRYPPPCPGQAAAGTGSSGRPGRNRTAPGSGGAP